MSRKAIDVIVAATVETNRRHANLTIDVGPRDLGQHRERDRAGRPLQKTVVGYTGP